MKIVNLIIRVLLGLMMLVFGLNKFLSFMPQPEHDPGPFVDFMIALGATGYMMPLVAALEVLGGALLLIGKFKPLALILLAPVMLNAFLAHLILDPAGVGAALLAMVMIVYLIFTEWNNFKRLLKA